MTHYLGNARTVLIDFEALEPVDEAPATQAGIHELPSIGGASLGVWEMLPGVMRNTDEDEVFIVLSGSATVAFEGGESRRIGPGDMVQLREGETSLWTVHQTLRKVYICV